MLEIKLVDFKDDCFIKKFGEEESMRTVMKEVIGFADDDEFWNSHVGGVSIEELKLEFINRLVKLSGGNEFSPSTLQACFTVMEDICLKIDQTKNN